MKRLILFALSCVLLTLTARAAVAPITGIFTTCVGSSTPLFDTTLGGAWLSSNPSVATVNSSGVVTGFSAGTTTISYVVAAEFATAVVTVSPAPIVSGTEALCSVGLTTTLVATPPGGIWSPLPPGFFTVGVTTGVVTATAPGTGFVRYTISPTCYVDHTMSVAYPIVIDGPDTLCVGSSSFYHAHVPGDTVLVEGCWSSSDSSIVTLLFCDGPAVAVSPGVATLTYTVGSCIFTKTVTVTTGSATITGIPRVCIGGTTTLSGSPSGGVWSSSTTIVATVGSASGVVTGVSPGTTTVSYASGGCSATRIVTVGAMPAPITGPSSVCAGSTITLFNSTTGGTWTSGNPSVATIDPLTGVVTGNAPGTAIITYSTGCEVYKTITVNPAPAAISGSATLCLGSTSTYTSGTPGGTWSSGTPAVVTISPAGVATGVALGSALIYYTLPTGCYSVFAIVVTSSSSVISGAGSVCAGASVTWVATPGGGTWSSANPSVATVGSTGVVTGIAAGTALISYSLGGCATSQVITVIAGPSAISGSNSFCAGSTSLYSSTPSGGTWSTANPAVATINPTTGMATGVSAGFTFITYTLPSGCYTIKTVTVTTTTAGISGASAMCQVGSTTFTGTPPGGTWTSSNTAAATIGLTSGIITGVGPGTTTITYIAGGCFATKVLTVNPTPQPVLGTDTVCLSATATYTSASPGGTWSVSNPAIASISAAGVLTPIISGVVNVLYTLPTGCMSGKTVTIVAGSAAISGGSSVCVGGTLTLVATPPGGLWSSSNPLIASVGSTGVVTAVTTGVTTISYTFGGCATTHTITVTAAPGVITGASTVCVGGSITLSNATPGGTWSVTPGAVATISGSGVLTGITPGSAIVTYSIGSCFTTKFVTVNPGPGAITGAGSICIGGSLTLSNATPGGFWTSGNATVATVDGATGAVTGLSAGTAVISYTAASCTVTTVVTVSASPATISGPATICSGSSATYTNSVGGGSWSVSNPLIATIGATTGVLTGSTTGVVTISYSISGCIATKVVTVTATPSPIAGPSSVCVGATITLTNSAAGGTWTSTAPTKATVDPATGVVTGMGAGVVTIQYTTSCGTVSKTISVNAAPAAITGATSLCVGTSSSFSTSTTGGVWSSSNSSIATITSTGLVTAVSPGVVTISYTKSGCSATKSLTVNAVPGPIAGSSILCVGATTAFTNSVPGGTWTSGNPLKANIDATTGIATGVATGTLNIYYSVGGCITSKAITVNASPSDIIGPSSLCAGTTITLASLTAGGTWSSSNTAIATVTTTGGLVNGISAGVVTISYTKLGCSKTRSVTVNATPGPINGSSTVCVGSTTTLTNTVPGGTWTSSNPSKASVDASGVVTGISSGTAIITYATPCGSATKTVTVNAALAAIGGTTAVCEGGTTTLTNAVPGGTWTSSDTSVAAVGYTSGMVTGVAAGTATITYMAGGCSTTIVVTVNALPSPITGAGSVCVGGSLTLSSATPGGVWSSANPTVATISASGVVSGVSVGTAMITYGLASGCFITTVVTVTSGPSPISGSLTVCAGTSTSLTSSPAGGIWSSSNSAVATVGSTAGLVTGVTPGVAVISYSVGGCLATVTVTVSASASPIAGPSTICAGGTATYTNATSGGVWSSSNTSVATIGSTTGVLTALSTGVTVLTYSAGGCNATMTVSVSAGPTGIFGTAMICAGNTTTLSSTPGGGTWTSSTPSVATIGSSTGVVTGIAAGTAMITYSVGACSVTRVVTVNPAAGPISGPSTVCVGGSITLTGGVPGGLWLTSNFAIASIDSATGVLTGTSAGVVSVTYIVGSCFASTTVTVTPGPPAIGGPSNVCVGSTIILTNSVPGGTWSSSNPSVAAVTVTSGIAFGVSPGTATITYSVGSCSVTKVVTVITAPAPISGSSTVCAGSSTLLTDATAGGVWSSSNASVASVSASTGMVTGVSAGVATITYSIGGCFVSFGITVTPAPGPISGPSSVCAGSSITLTDATPGGAWSSSAPSTATVSLSGVVTGLSSGVVTITYSVGGCSVTKLVTVNATPAPIVGASSVCTGSTTVFTNAVPGGVWTSSNPSRAAVGATSGVVTGITAGAAVITYSIGGCFVVKTIGVTPGPSPISGPSSLCVGTSAFMTSTPGGGVWSSSDFTVAAVSASGFVTAVGPGVATITYSVGGCDVTRVLTVNNTPAPIAGPSTVCAGATIILTNSVSGGVWTSSNPSVAAVSTSGVVTGITAGGAIITYSIGGCFVVRTIAVNASPAPIVGGSNICIGTPLVLSDATPGGIWSVSAPSVATVSISGVVNGISPGAVTVSYTVGGCSATKPVTVNQTPSAIAGPSSVCAGASITLTNSVPGGVWTTSNSVVAPVSPAGVVSGNASGVAAITYSIGGCFATRLITVNANPGPISGAGSVCSGSTTTYTNPVPGGVWTSAAPATASVGITTGIVTGVSAGTAVITYSIGSCFAVRKLIVVDCSSFGTGKETGVEEVTAAAAFSVFPNPASGNLNISWDAEIGKADIILTDAVGREVARYPVDGKPNGKQQIDVANLTDGMYMVTVRSETVQYTSRIVIRR